MSVAALPERGTIRLGAWRSRLTARRVELTGHAVVFALLVLVAIVPDLAATHPPFELVAQPFLPPGGEHLLGTDEIGRDLYSRIVHGLGISLASAVLAVAVGLVLGAAVGIPSGYRRGGWLDSALSRLTESVMAIPSILFTRAVITTFGRGTFIAAIAIGNSEAPGFARLIRGCVIHASSLTYVEAARTCGASPLRVTVRHVVPTILPPLLSYTALHGGVAMLALGAVSYLGFGEEPPSPEWGALIASGQKYLTHAWWVALTPGIVLAVVVILLNRVAYLLQERRR